MKRHLILAALLLLSIASIRADVITLTTNKAVAEKIKIALNAVGEATLAGGNGELQTVEFFGRPIEIEVKDAALTLTTEKALTSFYAPDAGLETLVLTQATSLVQLVVPDNRLTTINLKKNKVVEVVELQNNALKSLSLSGRDNQKLTYLNCANNQLTTLSVPSGASSPLRVLICSGNQLTKAPTVSLVAGLETVWMGQNALEGNIQLPAAKNLRLLNIEGNKLENLELPENVSRLEGLWANGNRLQSFDFSGGVPALKCLATADNRLAKITWATGTTGTIKNLDYVNLSGNSLFFNSFPITSNVKKMVLAPQNPFFFADTVNVNTSFGNETWLQLANKRLEVGRSFVMYDAQGNALVKGTSGDYNYTNRGVFTFYTHQVDACFVVTSPKFEGVELRSLPFCAFDPETGIEEIIVEKAEAGSVYDLQGRIVSADADNLPAGIYIVKGQKVLVK